MIRRTHTCAVNRQIKACRFIFTYHFSENRRGSYASHRKIFVFVQAPNHIQINH